MSANRSAVTLAILVLVTPTLGAAERPDSLEVARRIDDLMSATWKKNSVVPANPADDAEFFRRVTLDVAGRIPTPEEVQKFLADTSAAKRTAYVEQLLGKPEHHSHFARLWRDLLLPLGARPPAERTIFEGWLRERFAANTPYHTLARELIAANTRGMDPRTGNVAAASLYVRSLGTEPGNYAASTARVFLGLPMECARCHNHPFAHWTRTQFWELAAVFEEVEEVPFKVAWAPRIRIPDTDRVVLAKLPDGTAVKDSPGTPRDQFARWLAKPDNPYFAKATVNRVWGIFFGATLAEPPIDPADPPAPHAAALDALAQAFIQSDFDLRFLVRTITATRAYQLTSAVSHPTHKDADSFARMAIKPLSAEQLADSLAVATGLNDANSRAAILARFAGSNGEVTILQALWWMNGEVISRGTTFGTIWGVSKNDKFDTGGKLEALFLATLSRLPSPAEVERFSKYVETGGPRKNPEGALADVFWVLLNSTEFAVNH